VPELLRVSRTVKEDPAIAAWFAAQPADLRALAAPWFERMRHCGPDVREVMHDGVATVCVDDAPFAYVGVFTAHVTVGFYHGSNLPDRARLLKGTGKQMRHVKLKPGAALDQSALEDLISAAHSHIRMRLMFGD